MTRPSFSGVFNSVFTLLIVEHFFRFVPEMFSKILASNQQEVNGPKDLVAFPWSREDTYLLGTTSVDISHSKG